MYQKAIPLPIPGSPDSAQARRRQWAKYPELRCLAGCKCPPN